MEPTSDSKDDVEYTLQLAALTKQQRADLQQYISATSQNTEDAIAMLQKCE